MKKILNRLKRLEGQLSHVRTSIENEASCTEVLTQFLATKGALESALEEYLHASLEECGKKTRSEAETRKIINILIKKG